MTVVKSNDDIQKILQELMSRLEDIEVAVELHKLIHDGFTTDIENRVRMLEDDAYIDATMKLEDLSARSFTPDTLWPFLCFLQQPLMESILVKMLSILELRYNKKINATTLHEITITSPGNLNTLKSIQGTYSEMRHEIIAHINRRALLEETPFNPICWDIAFADIEKLSTIFKEVADEYGVKIIDLRRSRRNEGIVSGLRELFKILTAFRQCWQNEGDVRIHS